MNFEYTLKVLFANTELVDVLNEPTSNERKKEIECAMRVLNGEGFLENCKIDRQDIRRVVFYKNMVK